MPDHSNPVHVDSVPWESGPSMGTRFGCRYRRLGRATGSRRLGCSMYEVEPGKTAFPYHCHMAVEEAIYVLAGTGTLRLDGEEVAVEPGTYVAFPPGRDHAHQLVNTGTVPLRYLCMSADRDPDVAFYPDSGKVAYFGNWVETGPFFRGMFREDQGVGYFDGEETE